MTQQTAPSLLALPGRVQSFLAKTPAAAVAVIAGALFKPYITKTGLGIGQEIEIEIMETDSVDFLLTNVDLTVRTKKD